MARSWLSFTPVSFRGSSTPRSRSSSFALLAAVLWSSFWVFGALVTVGSVIVLDAMPAHAADDEDDADDEKEEADYARVGPYVRGSAELALVTDKERLLFAPPVSWQPEFGLDIALGWRNSERFALEAEFEWITNTDGFDYGSWLLGVNGKFYFAEGRFQPYAILGAGAMWIKRRGAPSFEDDWAFRNGIGVDYYFTEHWALNGEVDFVWGVGDLWKDYFMSFAVGAMYRF